MKILKMAWRNIWRNQLRSLIVMGAVIAGIWAIIFLMSFSEGMAWGYIKSNIENELAHIQFHDTSFIDEPEITYFIKKAEDLKSHIDTLSFVKCTSLRTITFGMVATPKGSQGIKIVGINPSDEKKVSAIHTNLIEGEYLPSEKRNPAILSKRMATKLGVGIRNKIVLTFQDISGNITSGAFRIYGIFETKNAPFDDGNLFIRRNDFNRLLGSPNLAHEFAILLKDQNLTNHYTSILQNSWPNYSVKSYREISPDIEMYEEQIKMSSWIFIVIVMLALIFGIINTMLMAVLERYKELGILMAIGMKRTQVFFMIMSETIILSLLAAPMGMLVGYLSVIIFTHTGIDLSLYAQGMRQYGLDEIIYPKLNTTIFYQVMISIVFTAIIAAIYPAIKAIRLNPIEAIRKL